MSFVDQEVHLVRWTKKVRVLLICLMASLLMLCIIFCCVIREQASRFYNFFTLIMFAIVALCLVVISSLLIYIITKHFKNDLQKETRQLIISQIFFVLTFLIRLILIFLVQFKHWADYVRDFNKDRWEPSYSYLLPLQFIFYNLIPIGVLLYLHFLNFGGTNDNQQVPLV